MRFVFTVLLALAAGSIFAAPGIRVPAGAQYYIYFKDIKNFENGLRSSGMFALSDQYFGYLLDYFRRDHPVLNLYHELRSLDGGSFFRSQVGETALYTLSGETVIALRMEKASALFAGVLSAFQARARFGGYAVHVAEGVVFLSRSEEILKQSISSGVNTDPALSEFLKKDQDVLFYTIQGGRAFTGLSDYFSSYAGVAVSVDFSKKSVTAAFDRELLVSSGTRSREIWKMVPAAQVFHCDLRVRPYDVLSAFTGGDDNAAMKALEKDFDRAFESQVFITMPELNADRTEPSFMLALRTKDMVSAEKTIRDFMLNILGEKGFDRAMSGQTMVNKGKESGIYYYLQNGFLFLTDSVRMVKETTSGFSSRTVTVWDAPENAKLRELNARQMAFNLNCGVLAQQLFSTMQRRMPDLKAQDRQDIREFLKALQGMGSIVGYGEVRNSLTVVYLVFKN